MPNYNQLTASDFGQPSAAPPATEQRRWRKWELIPRKPDGSIDGMMGFVNFTGVLLIATGAFAAWTELDKRRKFRDIDILHKKKMDRLLERKHPSRKKRPIDRKHQQEILAAAGIDTAKASKKEMKKHDRAYQRYMMREHGVKIDID